MTRFSPLRVTLSASLLFTLAACTSTRVVHEWHAESGAAAAAGKVAVIVMLPDDLQRLSVERVVVEKIGKAGGKAVVSSNIPGMRGRLTREKAERALKKVNADGAVVVFLTGGGKGEKLQRADYHLQYEGTAMYYDWFAPQFTTVYSVQEGTGYYDQTREIFVESSYFDVASGQPRWTIITESGNLEYSDTAKAVASKIVAQMRRDGTL